MNKGLEALNDFVKELCFEKNVIHKHPTLYELKNDANYKTIEKGLKALEIIKEKEVDIHLFKISANRNHYNWLIENRKNQLTQEEFDLLKEVLL